MDYKHTCYTIFTHFQDITNNICDFGRPFFAPSFFTRPQPIHHISTRTYSFLPGWTGIYIKLWSQVSARLCYRLRAGPEVIKPYSVLMLNSVLRPNAQQRIHAHGGYKMSWLPTQLSMPPSAYLQWRANEGARLMKLCCFFINRRSRNGTLSSLKVRIHVNKYSVVC